MTRCPTCSSLPITVERSSYPDAEEFRTFQCGSVCDATGMVDETWACQEIRRLRDIRESLLAQLLAYEAFE